MKIGDLVEWIYDKDIGIVTKTEEPQQVWIESALIVFGCGMIQMD